MRAMIDVNVLLDVLQRRGEFFISSARVCDLVSKGAIEGLVSAHAVTTIFYVMRKLVDPVSAGKALDWLLRTFDVAEVGKAALQRARGLGFEDFEDAVVAAAAESARCDYIVTRNLRDFSGSPVAAVEPAELLASRERFA